MNYYKLMNKVEISELTTDKITEAQSQSLQHENILSFLAVLRRIVYFCKRINTYISANKSKIYLVVTLATILYQFYSYSQFRKDFICDLNKNWECLQYHINPLQKKILTIAMLMIADCSIFIFYIYAFVYKKTYRTLTGLGIIQQILFLNIGTDEVSYFNLMGLIKIFHQIILLVLVLLVVLAASIRLCCKKSVILTVGGFIALFSIFYFVAIHNQCQSWKTGINGEIQEFEGSCKMNVPICSYLKGIALIDFNFYLHNCFLGEDYKKNFNEGFSYNIENGPIVGFSDLKNVNEYQRAQGYIPKTVVKSAKRYKTLKQARETMEHDVIFDTDDQRYYIQVLRNQTLAKEKDELYKRQSESPSPPLVKNVLLIFMDSVSRYETTLKLPKLVEWFKKQAKHRSYSKQEAIQQSISQSKSEAYEFYKYHSVGYYTRMNLYPMFFGQSIDQMKAKKNSNQSIPRRNVVQKVFSERGFITSWASSDCASFGVEIYQHDIKEVVNPTFDHQTFSFNCDTNFHDPNIMFSYAKGIFASTDRCLYRKTMSEYTYQYTTSFFDKYKNSSKFSQITLLEGHTIFGGSVRYIDSGITSFLEQLQTKGHLKDTLVIAVSDHGQHLGKTHKSISSDHYHPLLYMAVPQTMNNKYRDSIRLNQQNLVTAYNIFHFLKHTAIGESYADKELGLLGDLSFQANCSTSIGRIYDCYCE